MRPVCLSVGQQAMEPWLQFWVTGEGISTKVVESKGKILRTSTAHAGLEGVARATDEVEEVVGVLLVAARDLLFLRAHVGRLLLVSERFLIGAGESSTHAGGGALHRGSGGATVLSRNGHDGDGRGGEGEDGGELHFCCWKVVVVVLKIGKRV